MRIVKTNAEGDKRKVFLIALSDDFKAIIQFNGISQITTQRLDFLSRINVYAYDVIY